MIIFHRARARGWNGEEVELEGPKEWVEEWMMKMVPFMDITRRDVYAIKPDGAKEVMPKRTGDS